MAVGDFTPLSMIKSIQRGIATLNTGTTLDVTITSVDPAKAMLIVNSIGLDGSTSQLHFARGRIVNATTISFTRPSSAASTTVDWQVVEYV
jgi:hypothetical protein